jgi:hypothetical protein
MLAHAAPDGKNAIVRPVARGIEKARRGVCSYPEGTAAHIAPPLMIPFGMEMFDIFAQGSPQGALAKEDHVGQAFLFHMASGVLAAPLLFSTLAG